MALATTSLPTPLSPRRSTVVLVPATLVTMSQTGCILLLVHSLNSPFMKGPLRYDERQETRRLLPVLQPRCQAVLRLEGQRLRGFSPSKPLQPVGGCRNGAKPE